MNHILSELVITKVYSISTMYTPASHNKIIRKNRPSWGLIFKQEGETIYKNHISTYVSDKNHLIILPKNASYEWTCTHAGHYTIIDFESDLEIDELFSLKISDADSLLKTLKSLEILQLSPKAFSNMESIYLVYSLILNALKSHHENTSYAPSAKKNILLPAMKHILTHFTTLIKNEDLAALCGISVVYFRKLFSEVYGVSPITYIQNLRIRRAKEILRSDYSSITDIALTLGYNNIYEFSKAFKKHTGVSPSKY